MPEISRFYGIIIKMYFDDHTPPHFHAQYGEHEALLNINTFGIIAGSLPPKALGLVTEWATIYKIRGNPCYLRHPRSNWSTSVIREPGILFIFCICKNYINTLTWLRNKSQLQ